MSGELDPALLQDFITESSELVDQLDSDLIRLEDAEDPRDRSETLNSIFRAMHTIKGGAGFLALDNVTTFAHAAEDALNHLRQGSDEVTATTVDTLLRSADQMRIMIDALGTGDTPPACPEELLEALRAIAASPDGESGAENPAASNASATPTAEPMAEGEQTPGDAPPAAPCDQRAIARDLELPSQKADLLGFMTADLREAGDQLAESVAAAQDSTQRLHAAERLLEITEGLAKVAEFFELPALDRLAGLARRIGETLPELEEPIAAEQLVRLDAIHELIIQQADALEQHRALDWPLDLFEQRIQTLAEGQPLDPSVQGQHEHSTARLMQLDGITSPEANPAEGSVEAGSAGAAEDEAAPAAADAASPSPDAGKEPSSNGNAAKGGQEQRSAEQTIRVEVGRLEYLLNLVGQMVLAKNRMLGIGRRLLEHNLPQDITEEINSATNDLDRLTGNLQVGVMRTRMQPVAKMFDRYPRVVRDIARATDKKIQLQITGRETEVDKSVLELLSDPLVHILRNSADHGIEPPDDRREQGKEETGTIHLSAEHRGSHVHLAISDNGRGLDRDQIATRAIERGLTTEEKVAALSDQEVFEFIFSPGFSTAPEITDLSGRGVGMDVVRTNLSKMSGSIHIDSEPGRGTTIELQIPLTVAIMPSMVVGIADEMYCVPLQNIVEIVRPDESAGCDINGQPVIRLRDHVLPLVDLRDCLSVHAEESARFALVVNAGGQRAGILVDRLVGQQEIVIKPLDDTYTKGGPFSGATIQDTGEVSLILDVARLVRQANGPDRAHRVEQAA